MMQGQLLTHNSIKVSALLNRKITQRKPLHPPSLCCSFLHADQLPCQLLLPFITHCTVFFMQGSWSNQSPLLPLVWGKSYSTCNSWALTSLNNIECHITEDWTNVPLLYFKVDVTVMTFTTHSVHSLFASEVDFLSAFCVCKVTPASTECTLECHFVNLCSGGSLSTPPSIENMIIAFVWQKN